MKTRFVFVVCAALACAQEPAADRVAVPFSDASKARSLVVSLMNGSISVTGAPGKEAVVEARSTSGPSRRRSAPREAEGLRRIGPTGHGLTIEERDNVVTVGAGLNDNMDLKIQVPTETAVKLRTINGGHLRVEGISGEIDVHNVNGSVTVTNVSGSVVAHALNGKVLVTLDRVTASKAMSFSSLNGDIDVTLPVDVKANVKMKSDHGDIFTDFEIQLDSSRAPTVQNRSDSSGKYNVQFDRALIGKINGGGPELSFTTLNGRIFIRQKK